MRSRNALAQRWDTRVVFGTVRLPTRRARASALAATGLVVGPHRFRFAMSLVWLLVWGGAARARQKPSGPSSSSIPTPSMRPAYA